MLWNFFIFINKRVTDDKIIKCIHFYNSNVLIMRRLKYKKIINKNNVIKK